MFRRGWRRGKLPAAVFLSATVFLVGAAPSPGHAADQAALIQQGQALFQQRCSGCHGIGGGDRPTGPDLAGVTTRQSRAWLERFIREPDKVIAAGDPEATRLLARFHLPMPNLGLSGEQVRALLAYLATTGPAAPAQATPPPKAAVPPPPPSTGAAAPAAAPAGDSAAGEELFVGTRPMKNGGAPCLGCHGIAGLGPAGGASFGPDLTTLYASYGASGVASVLAALPFPSMQPIFAKRPLTPVEQANLAAFFRQAAGKASPRIDARLIWKVILALAILAALVFLFGRRRLRGVRREMVAKTLKREGEAR